MPNHKPLPPIDRLNELFEIVPIAKSQFGTQSGLVWKVSQGPQKAGSVAGTKRPHSVALGRFDWKVQVDRRFYYVSRVLYLMANGIDPGELEVDHENQNHMDNNVENLRLLARSPQCHNRGIFPNNTSGAVGVSPLRNGKWKAELTHKGGHFYLGCHTCKIAAAHAYNNKVIELELDKLGKPLNDIEALKCGCEKCL